jgi:alpha-tubulin suppressor-like RCC1 family protein
MYNPLSPNFQNGQMGFGDTTSRIYPQRNYEFLGKSIVRVECGADSTIMMDKNGVLFSVGSNMVISSNITLVWTTWDWKLD